MGLLRRRPRSRRFSFSFRRRTATTVAGVDPANAPDRLPEESLEETTSRDLVLRRLHRSLAPLRDQGENDVLFGLDVDGTLVDHDGDMSAPVHEALQAAADAQHVVIATGRSLGATLPIVQAAGVDRGFAVCSNGAVTVQLDPDIEDGWRIADSRTFQPGEALRALREVAPSAHYAVEDAEGGFYATPGFQDASFGVMAEATPIDELLEKEAVRVVVHVPDLTPDEFATLVKESGVHGVQYSIGWTAWLDMAAPGVSKATALEGVRDRLGIALENTIAVGDGFNDVEMLHWAGVGVAMGQAMPGVKAHADVETLDVWNDGAAEVLSLVVG